MLQKILMALYAIFLFSIPFKNVVFQLSIGLINLVFLFVIVRRKEGILFLKNLAWLPVALAGLFCSMGISSALGISGREGWEEMAKHVARFWPFLLATIYFSRKKWVSADFLGKVITLALFFHAANGIVQFFWGFDLFGRPPLEVAWGEDRLRGAVYNSNLYGFLMALGVVMAFALGGDKRSADSKASPWVQVFYGGFFILAFWTLLQSGSRGAWLGAVGGLMLAGCCIPGFWWRKSTLISALLFSGFLGLLFRTNALFQERMLAMLAGNTSYRAEVWQECWRYFLQSPLWGHGIGAYARMERVYADISSPHNIFISILLELGVLGLLSYLFFFGLIIWRILYFPENQRFRPVFLGIFTVFLVYGQFGSTMVTDKIYLSCWYLLVALVWAHPGAVGKSFS